MKNYKIFTLLALLASSACTTTGKNQDSHQTSIDLAKSQWESCSHYPSVELVEITPEGKLLVRDLHYSSPPIDFLRCIARVSYQQVLSGTRPAKSLVRDAYFVDAKPDREYLYKPSGHYPEQIDVFSPEHEVYFFFVIEVPNNAPVQVSFEWRTPLGKSIRTNPRKIKESGAAARKWSIEQLGQTNKALGNWSVRLFIDEFEAGEYFFKVE
jgi:hypothetical protein